MTTATRDRKWNWVWRNAEMTEKLFQVGILADGTLYNPNGYPDDIVRAATLGAETRQHERRSEAAKEAAKTRARRAERRVWFIAKRIANKQGIRPADRCYVCGKHLTDAESTQRGVGPECWGGVLQHVEAILASREATDALEAAS